MAVAAKASELPAGQRRPNTILLGAGCSAQVALGASTKIQQKQQKFLAAAARSATGAADPSGCGSQRCLLAAGRHRQPQQSQQQQQQQQQPSSTTTTTQPQPLPDAAVSPALAHSRTCSRQQARPADGLLATGAQLRPCATSSPTTNTILIGSTRECNDCQHSNVNNNHHNPQHQHYSNQLPHTMAHYKFHNDCQSSVLTYEQVKRLDFVMNQTVPIHGRGNFPTLYVKLRELIRLVRQKLQKEHSIEIRDVRLNGGAASYVLAPENSHYNDLDLVFGTDLSDENRFDVIRDVVLECLEEFYPKAQHFNDRTCESERNYGSNDLSGLINDGQAGTAQLDRDGSIIVSGMDPNELKGRERSLAHDRHSEQVNEQTGLSDCDSVYGDSIGSTTACDRRPSVQKSETDAGSLDLNSESETGDRESSPDQESAEENTNEQCQVPDDQAFRTVQNFQYQPSNTYQMPLNSCAIKEAYVHKMVKVNDDDRWSLISLGVQQQDAVCCAQTGCPQPSLPQHCSLHSQQAGMNPRSDGKQTNSVGQQVDNIQTVIGTNSIIQAPNGGCQYHQPRSVCAKHQHRCPHHAQHHQKQFPNSIELKFVDRMRRKFEFSVDSFQIILDFLMKFYDYAPQSTMSSQGNFATPHPSSTMISAKPLINKRHCAGCCVNRSMLEYKLGDRPACASAANSVKTNQQALRHQASAYTVLSGSISVGTSGFYQLPTVGAANSLSISSVASSSGCSSSSSVVSSSSSSMSSDEDHEDLDCDADGPSSSSASTSSLLSSNNMSSLASESARSGTDVAAQAKLSSHLPEERAPANVRNTSAKRNQINKDDLKNASASSTKDSAPEISKSASDNPGVAPSLKPTSSSCAECYAQQANLVDNITTDLETSSMSSSCAVISENFYPTVIGRSEYGDFKEALYHLETKQIATRSPEEIRGGGLLKYCNLLVKQYRPTNSYQIRTLERYMCSRFFIDFNDLSSQQAKLESYLANHFSDDPMLKFDYLTILHMVVQRSTVCLMSHELRLTLSMIRDMALSIQNASKRPPTCCM